MKKFEYLTIHEDWNICERVLNNLGKVGWELVTVTINSGNDNATAYFKREIIE
jgi:hypothetical protein